MRAVRGLVKTLWPLLLVSACARSAFALSGAELAAAEQRGFDREMARHSDADLLFIAHQWQAGACRWSWVRTAACQVQARVSEKAAWMTVTARLQRRDDGVWVLQGATWPRR